MERLTYYSMKGSENDGYYLKPGVSNEEARYKLGIVEEILGDCDLDRLAVLLEADQKNRCIISPVNVGTIIYQIMFDKLIIPRKIIEISLDINDKGVRYYYKTADKTGVISYIGEAEIEKTVFLAKAGAKSALKEMKRRK